MKHFEFKVADNVIDYLERLAFEVEGMKKVVKEIITDAQDNPMVLEGAAFKKYDERYQQRNASYEVAKQAVQDAYIPEDIQKHVVRWDINFSSGLMSFDADVADDCVLPMPSEVTFADVEKDEPKPTPIEEPKCCSCEK